MGTPQIKLWYRILNGGLLLAGFVPLGISFFAEYLGIDSGGSWGIGRSSLAGLGALLVGASALLQFPAVKTVARTHTVANLTRYFVEAALWMLLALGLCELALRAIVIYAPEKTFETGWGDVPLQGSRQVAGTEGYGVTHYLAHGEIVTPWEGGGTPVVAIGDSHTEALQVSDGMKFVSLAEARLRSKGVLVNLHNLGRNSLGISDYVFLAPLIRQDYGPQVVVFQLSAEDFWGEEGGDSFNRQHRSYFVETDAGDLELLHNDQHFQPNLYTRLTSQWMLYAYGRERWGKIAEKFGAGHGAAGQPRPAPANSEKILPVARLADQLKLLKEAYAGTKIILLLLPFSPQIEQGALNFDDPEYLKILNSAEDVGGFYIVDPRREFNRLAWQGRLPRGFMNSLPGKGHLNEFGHAIVAELLAEKIMEITR